LERPDVPGEYTGLNEQNRKEKQMKYTTLFLIFSILIFSCVCTKAKHNNPSGQNKERLGKLREAVKTGKIAYKLTGPNEIKELLGEPQTEEEIDGGGMMGLDMG